MKHLQYIKKYLLIALIAVVSFTGCNDDFVNTKPLDEVTDREVWRDPSLARAFVLELYNGFGQGGFDEQMQASLTDEALFTHPGRGINTITESRSNPADQGWINYNYNWSDMYSRIRATNIAIENLENPSFGSDVTQDEIDVMLGETYFMRAFFYQQLMRYYGAVPIIDFVYELGTADYSVPRATFEELIAFIVKDCETAASLLEGANLGDGRTSSLASKALKARVLLYAASDLHDITTASLNSSLIAGYSNPEYLGYTSGSQSNRWELAFNAAQEVVQEGEGYKLDLSGKVSPEVGEANYIAASLAGGSAVADAEASKEIILGRYFVDEKNEGGANINLYNGPNGYHNWSGNTPTQDLVDAYETIEGETFSWSNQEHASNPYQDRDPRFYASILYDGADWKPRTSDVAGSDPYGEIQTGRYEIINNNGEKVTYWGLDTRNSDIEDWNGSYTGYTMRKFIDPDPAIIDQNTRQTIPFPMFRYTEAVLNYIEAAIETGREDMAREWLNKIRFRAGMPAITDTGEELMNRYRNERRIELAYEEHRFHDVRRWMIAPEKFGNQIRTIEVRATLKSGANVTQYHYDPDSYNYNYTPAELNPGVENRQWLDKMYFISIHRDEMNRNDLLVQNPGY